MLQSSANGVLEDHLNLDQTAALLPFPLIVSAHLPENTSFLDATVNTDGSVWLRYVTYHLQSYQSLLYIYEKVIGNSPPPTMTIGASADVIVTRIESLSGSALGEYVRGDWLLTPSITPPVGNSLSGETHDVWQWDNTSSSQRLRLGQNGILIAMYYRVEKSYTPVLHEPGLNDKLFYVSTLLGQGELVQIASGMMLFSDVHAEVTCNPPGQTETDTSMSTDAIGSGQLCSPTLQARQHNITNGALVIK